MNKNRTILHIAGHGPLRNGGFDPGATGLISQGEWRYYANEFFDALRKYEQPGFKVIYHTAYNVYDYGDIVALAKKYNADIVIEWHFDAMSTPNAHGGHVIVYSGFAPDALDLRLRDALNDAGIGVRYEHRGHRGISGRSDLANVNRAARGGVNYRLMETGFGTSPRDSKILLNEMDKVARETSEALFNTEIKKKQPKDTMAGYHVVVSGETLWGIGQKYGVTVAQLKSWNNLDSDLIFPGQSLEVRGADLPLPKPEPKPKATPPATPSNQIKVGNWVRVPANKLYAKGNDTRPVKSKEHSGRIETINNNWKNQLRLKNKDGSWLGFARISDITGGNFTASRPKGKTLHLPRTVDLWRIYDVNGPYTVGNQIHFLTPNAFPNGITYEILEEKGGHVYIINTGVKGRVAIYAGPETGATIR